MHQHTDVSSYVRACYTVHKSIVHFTIIYTATNIPVVMTICCTWSSCCCITESTLLVAHAATLSLFSGGTCAVNGNHTTIYIHTYIYLTSYTHCNVVM